MSDEELGALVLGLPDHLIPLLLDGLPPHEKEAPASPADQALELDEGYRLRDHLTYLSDRLTEATRAVEQGESRYIVVSMPPRMGKSHLTSIYLPLWLLRTHPQWKLGLISHSPTLAVFWGRQVRRIIEEHGADLGLSIARDAGAASEWQTTAGGGIVSRSAPGQSITGLGFKVLLIDDAVKDFAAAHSANQRDALWDWWLANAQTRLEPPSLVVVIGTRWHEDDLIGRLLSMDMESEGIEWEVIAFPAIAEDHDVLGREPGEPLLSPLLNETKEEALERWDSVRRAVGSYTWASLYQQRPAPAKGAIFDTGWWKFWTTDPDKATEDGRVVHLDPHTLSSAMWIDSWDTTFKDGSGTDYVVGQRWVRFGENRYLVAQQRGKWSFTQTLERMEDWLLRDDQFLSPYGQFVHTRLVEDSASGPALLDVLKSKVTGLRAVRPRSSKENRARAATPEIEEGYVYLPLPSDPGNEWVSDLLSELRNFPHDVNDDQVDTLTQALSFLRDTGRGGVTVPGRSATRIPNLSGTVAAAARTDMNRQRGVLSGGRYR